VSEARDYKVIGTRVVRPDGVDKVTGRANFGADFSLPGMLYGKVLRSPHAHARIKKIDTDAAAKIEGVYAIVTGADFPKVGHEEITGGPTPRGPAGLPPRASPRSRTARARSCRWRR